jgi:hypothetical protein
VPVRELDREVLDQLDTEERRAFVKRIVESTSFATPVVASFELDSLKMGSAEALTPNGTPRLPRT